MHRTLTNKKLVFGLVGALNTLIDFGLFVMLSAIGVNTVIANTISTSCGMVSSFFLNRRFTFKPSADKQHIELIKFFAVTLTGLWIIQPIVIYATLHAVKSFFPGYSAELLKAAGKLVSIGVSLVWNYLWYNNYVFKQQPSAPSDSNQNE